jgi:hypothetical protein
MLESDKALYTRFDEALFALITMKTQLSMIEKTIALLRSIHPKSDLVIETKNLFSCLYYLQETLSALDEAFYEEYHVVKSLEEL